MTLRHFSDQLATLSGYKAEFKVFRPSLGLTLTPDTTVCYNQDIWLVAVGSGGSADDYSYTWNAQAGTDSLLINPRNDTTIYLRFGDDCMQEFIYDSIDIKVLPPLKILQERLWMLHGSWFILHLSSPISQSPTGGGTT